MNKKQYEEKRNSLMNEAQALINEGKTEEAQAKMDEVRTLDETWDAIAQAQADFNAMNREPQAVNPFGNITGGILNLGAVDEPEDMYDSKEYRIAFMNYVVNGKPIPEKFTNAAGPTKTPDI